MLTTGVELLAFPQAQCPHSLKSVFLSCTAPNRSFFPGLRRPRSIHLWTKVVFCSTAWGFPLHRQCDWSLQSSKAEGRTSNGAYCNSTALSIQSTCCSLWLLQCKSSEIFVIEVGKQELNREAPLQLTEDVIISLGYSISHVSGTKYKQGSFSHPEPRMDSLPSE